MPDPRSYHFKLPPYAGAPLPEPPVAWYPGIRPHHPLCTSDRMLRSDGRIRAFVIHATAGGGSAGAMSVMFEHRASWHWLIPDEDESEHGLRVWACAPERRAAWHVRNTCWHADVNNGSANVNYWSLGLEIVNQQVDDAFSPWQVEQAAALVRYAWSKYPELVDVVSHARLDPQRRSDPGTAFPWDRFQELVLAPAPPVERVASAAFSPISIVGPQGEPIACDPRSLDGVTVAEIRPLVEALGFKVKYQSGPPWTMRIVGSRPATRSRPKPKARRRKPGVR